MGHARPRPKYLAAKLLRIRKALGLSQPKLAKRLNAGIPYNYISRYELNKIEPPLVVLLAYSRVAEIPLERLVDDSLELSVIPDND